MFRHRTDRRQQALRPEPGRRPLPGRAVPLGAIRRSLVAGLGALTAAFAIWIVINMPQMAAQQAQSRRLQAAALADENRRLCQGWGLRPDSAAFRDCTLDLARLREEERGRAAREMSVF
jgi:hypothetical protein